MRYADGPTTEGTVHVAAPPARVWELVSDIGLVASLSPEVQSVEWLDGATGPVAGARFRGHNRHASIGEWSTVSYVVACDPPRTFAWDVHDPSNPAASWRFDLVERAGGTELRQWARMGPGPSGLTPAIERWPEKEERIVAGRLREFRAGIDATLGALKALAEQRAGDG